MRADGVILFIDWDGVNRDALKAALETHGFRVACAASEQEAREHLRRGERPSLALLDLTPAAAGASQFIHELKRDDGVAIPVVVFCPPRGESVPAAYLEADAFLHKPVEFDELLETVRRYCQGRPAPASTSAADGADGKARRKVLIVEDNPDGALTLRVLLELLGYEVTVANTGPDGVRVARACRPDVVLCDIGLPGLDGFGVAGELRRDAATAGARLIAVTAYSGDDTRRLARASGFDILLTKPADPAVLLKLLAGQATVSELERGTVLTADA